MTILQGTNLDTGRTLRRWLFVQAKTRGDNMMAEQIAINHGFTEVAGVCKAAVTAIDSGDMDAGFRPVAADIDALLRSTTILGRVQGVRQVQFRTRMLRQDVGGTGSFLEEGAPVPISAAGFTETETLEVRKCSGARILTVETVVNSVDGAFRTVAADAVGGVVEAIDAAFTDPANGGSASTPASISFGAPEVNSSGSTVAAIDADLKAMLAVLVAAECSLATAVWIMSPTSAVHLSLLRGSSGAPCYPGVNCKGGVLLGLPIITSTNIAASGSPGERHVILAEMSEISVADAGAAAVTLSKQAAVQLDNAPNSGAQQLVSLWQHNLMGILATKFINWSRRRTGAVCTLRNVTW